MYLHSVFLLFLKQEQIISERQKGFSQKVKQYYVKNARMFHLCLEKVTLGDKLFSSRIAKCPHLKRVLLH